ncbi:MAG TPA: hypothetical protein VFG31_10345 [Conexibacter sp.]|nr:hypothetical protein [Conexibacter sp.]
MVKGACAIPLPGSSLSHGGDRLFGVVGRDVARGTPRHDRVVDIERWWC